MSIEVSAISAATLAQRAETEATVSGGTDFVSLLQQVESNIDTAETQLAAFASGEADNLHQVMLSISKAKTAFEMTVQIRNRLLEGYQEILRMGV